MAAADELAGSSPVAGSKDEADADGSRRPERSGLKGRRWQGVGVSCVGGPASSSHYSCLREQGGLLNSQVSAVACGLELGFKIPC